MSYESRLKALRGNTSDDSADNRIAALRNTNTATNNMADLLPKPWITPEEARAIGAAAKANTPTSNGYVSMADLNREARENQNTPTITPGKGVATPGTGGGRGTAPLTGWDYVGSKQREVGEALANSPVGIVQRSLAGGVATGVRDIGNALGYVGQMQAQTAMMQADPYLRMWGQNDIADKNAGYVQQVRDEGYKPLGTVLERAGVSGATQLDQGVRDFANAAATDAKNSGKVLNVVAQTAHGVGGMVPNILANVVAPGSGMWVLAAKAFGNATESAIDAGASNENAVLYGGAVAAVEVLTEMMFDGIPGLRANGENVLSVSKGIEKAVGKYIKNTAAQNAVMAVFNILGEGAEEFVAEFGDWGLNKLLVGNDNRTLSEVHKDAWYSAFIGALISFVMSTPSNILNIMSPQEIADGVMKTEEANRTYKPDYFDNMTPAEAKAEYIRLMKQYHPDTSNDVQAAQYSAEINDAYDRYTKKTGADAKATQPETQTQAAEQIASLPAAQQTAQGGNIYQQALDAAAGNQQVTERTLPKYRPIERPVDAQRAQVGAEMAARAAAPAEAPAAQSANIAPVEQQRGASDADVLAEQERQRGVLGDNRPAEARHTAQQLSENQPASIREQVQLMTEPQPMKQSAETQDANVALAEQKAKPQGRTEEEKLAGLRRGYEQEKRIVAMQSPERQQYLKDTYDVAKPVLDQLRPGDTIVDDNGNVVGEVKSVSEYGITIVGDTMAERIPAGTFSNDTKVAGLVFGDDPLWHFEHKGQPVAQSAEMQYNGENTPKEVVTSGAGEQEFATERGNGRYDSSGGGSLRNNAVGSAEQIGGVDQGAAADRAGSPQRAVASEPQEKVGGAAKAGATESGNAEEVDRAWQTERAADKDLRGSVKLGREVSSEDLGFRNADPSQKVRLIESGSTPHIDVAKAMAKEQGLDIIPFAGGNLATTSNKYIAAFSQYQKNRIGIRTDHDLFTAEQFTGHEILENMIATGKVNYHDIADAVEEMLSEDIWNELLNIYQDLLSTNNKNSILKEMLCDAAGNMNWYKWQDDGVNWEKTTIDIAFSVIHDYLNEVTQGAFRMAPDTAGNASQAAQEFLSGPVSQDTIGNVMVDALDAGDIDIATEFSYASLAKSAGFEANEENGVRVFMRDGKPVKKVTTEDIKASPIGALIKYAADNGYLGNGKAANDENARKQIQFFADVCTLAAKNNDFAMSMQFAGAETFTAIKANSDTQYGTTYDYKSVCIKTQACIDQMSAAMVAKKGGLTKDEILGIYRDVNEIGLPVPCPECYVWNRWIGIGGLLDNIYKYQQRYGAMSFDEVKSAYDAMHDRVQAKAEEAGLSFGKAKTKLSAKITKEYQKQLDKVETTTNRGDKVSSVDIEKLRTLEATMTDVKALTWIEDVYFGGKPMTKDNVSKTFRVPTDILFDLNRGAEFATQYKDAWAFRTTQGAGYGKAITPYSEATLGEGILGTNSISKTVKDKAAGKLKNPFMDNNGELSDDAKKKLDSAVRKQKVQLFRGGQRFNSTSDASNDVASDYLLSMLEMQSMHGGVQIYTKVDGSVQYLSNVGAFINQSLMPLGSGLDAGGNLRDTTIGGMSPKAAFANRKKYENAGTITIGVNDDHIRALYKDDKRDFIIPYHVSGGDAAVVSESRAIQDPDAAEAARVRSSDYTRTQNEKVLSDVVLKSLGKDDTEIAEIKQNREARIAILTRNKPNMEVVRANPILAKLYDMFNGGKWDGVKLPKSEIESHIYPNEFWDTEADFANSGINTELYLQYCEDLGILHKFSGMVPRNGVLVSVPGYDSKGNRVQLTDLAYKYKDGEITEEIEPYYWKNLIDHRMYGNAGQPLEQGAINLSNLGADVVKDFAKKNSGRTYDQQKSAELAKKTTENFATEETDTEFSSEPAFRRVEAENERLKQRLAEARAETKVTRGWRADPKDVAIAAKTIAESASSTYSQPMLQSRLTKLVEEASNGEISEDEVMATAGSIARDVVEKSTVLASKDLTSYNTAKNYLKKVYIEVPEALRDSFDDFKTFAQTHKEMRMNTEGVTIADVYAELQRDLGKEYFPDMARAKDMLQQIGDVMNSLAPVYGNQYSFAMQMVIEEMSNEVLEAAMDIGQKITYADRAAAKLGEAKAETKAATEKLKTAESYIRSLQRIATRRAEQNEALKQHYADTMKRKREARDLRQSQDKLMRVLKRLNNRKLPMATKQEILDAQNAVAGVVDTVQKYFTGELKQKRWTEQGITDVGQLEEFIRRKTVEGLDPDMYDPNFIVDGATKRILDRYKMTSVKDMTATQLKELTQALLNIEARIAAEKKAVNSQLAVEFYEAGTQTIGDIGAAKPGNIQRKLRPLSAFLRMADYNDDSPLVVLYKEMLRGEEEADMYQREAIKPFSALLSNHKWLKSAYGKDATAIKLPGIDIDGNNVEAEITPMMRVELYLDSLNDDNFRHVYEGGVVVPDMEWYRKGDMAKAYNNGKRVRFTRPTLQRLAEQMTPEEREFAKLLQNYYNEFAPKRMNPVSLALDGWEKFTTPDYYPISVDKNFLNADYEAKLFAADASLARPGFGEERIHSAKPIYLRDANTRFLQMVMANAMYAHQAIPLHNMNRLLNVQMIGNADSVKAALNRQFPDGSADKYLSKFMADYAGHKRVGTSDIDKWLEKLRSNYSGGVLLMALSTAGVQAASYPTAAAVVSPAALFQALNPGAKIDTSFIDRRTAVFTKRTEGFSMMEIAELREQGKHIPKVLNWIQGVDVATTSLLKRAAYYEVRNTKHNLQPGTEEFEKAVTDTYIRIIEETQPNYSAALRPDVLRSDNAMERALIIFATQPLQQYGIVYDAIGRYESASRHYKTDKSEVNKAAKNKAAKGMGRAVGVILASSLAFAILRLGTDTLMGNFEKKYKPKEGSEDTEVAAFLRQFGMNMLGGITGMWPIGKTLVEFVEATTDTIVTNLGGKAVFGKKWYGVETATIGAINDAMDAIATAINYITRAINGKSETKTAVKKVVTAAEDIAVLFGIPAANVHKIIKAVAHWAGVEEEDLYDLIK